MMLTASDMKFLAACGITLDSGQLRPALSTQDVVMDAPCVIWRFWETAGLQSEYHRREVGIVDLGDISEIPSHKTSGTLEDLVQMFIDSFQALPPAEQVRVRSEIYEQTTGKPYRPITG